MAFEEDGSFNRKKFEAEQLPLLVTFAQNEGGQHVTDHGSWTIVVKADGTYKKGKRKTHEQLQADIAAAYEKRQKAYHEACARHVAAPKHG